MIPKADPRCQALPHFADSLLTRLRVAIAYSILFVFLTQSTSQAQAIQERLWVTDGQVWATAVSGNTLYIGGIFNQVGPPCGTGVPLDVETGVPLQNFPFVVGKVSVVAPDGAGGWYIGGGFSAVGGEPRSNIAHILSDNSVSPWAPQANGDVLALWVSGPTVYASGTFTVIGNKNRNHVAALDAATGIATVWNPNANARVDCLWIDGSTMYLGGIFTSIGGITRNRIAAVDLIYGIVTEWNTIADERVTDLLISGDTLYAAGDFTAIGGQQRNFIAALNKTTGEATAWNPNPNGSVQTMVLDGTLLYVGGNFTFIGEQIRNRLAALDTSSGESSPWAPSATGIVRCIAIYDSTVYAGGNFDLAGGQSRHKIAAFDFAGNARAWNPNFGGGTSFDDGVHALAATETAVYAGGSMRTVGGVDRHGLAAIDLTSGSATPWNPQPSGPVTIIALMVRNGTVYAAGQFSTIGGQPRSGVAAIDAATGVPTNWAPNPNNLVRAIDAEGTTIYVGGGFTSIGGQPRHLIAAIDAETGLATAWNPNPTTGFDINSLVVEDGVAYVSGSFIDIGGKPRLRIAALDLETGEATAWNPGENGMARVLKKHGQVIYAGGTFTSIGGQVRSRIAALDAMTGLATGWNPSADKTVYSLAVGAGTVYAGGSFDMIGGQVRNGLAALDINTGLATDWDPAPTSSDQGERVFALEWTETTVYAGGEFIGISNLPMSSLAGIHRDPAVGVPLEPIVPLTSLLSFPNPSQGLLEFSIRTLSEHAAPNWLKIYDVQGRSVRSMDLGSLSPGTIRVDWDGKDAGGRDVAAGTYFMRLESLGAPIATNKATILR